MAVPVLVVTPNTGFGELICQVLEEAGDYSIALTQSGQDALEYAQKKDFILCILDADTVDMSVKSFIPAMRQTIPEILFIIIPPDKQTTRLDDVDVQVNGFLSKPFYLPDLLVMVEETLKQSGIDINKIKKKQTGPLANQRVKKGMISSGPEWLRDVSSAAQHLTKLSLETSSQASLITRYDQVWAYAGELPQQAVEELGSTVSRYFADGGGSDLARFIHLDATAGDYMLYATGLGGEYVLAMVFDAEIPFSKMRLQANQLAQALSSPPGAEEEIEEENIEAKPQQPLLDDVPPPIPQGWAPAYVSASVTDQAVESDKPQIPVSQSEAETMVSESAIQKESAETLPSKTTLEKSKFTLEPVSPAMYNLTYACVLISRMPEHHLTGEIAALLSELVTQISVAFGWRLEHLSIRPDFFLWMVNVPPSTSPGYLMRIIRQHTSRRLFTEIPKLLEENPSGDFWAPGYLIMSGPQLPPTQLVKDFINDTRKRQGISK